MLKVRIIACLDVADGRVVKGVRFQGLRQAGDPVERASLYQEQGADEIAVLDKSIQEIDSLERDKERLLARMEIIDQLQKSRPEIVHLFDEMTRQLPEGVYLTGIKQSGSRIEVRGVAQSSTRVSALMRQIDESDWVGDPEVERVETTNIGTSRQSEFVVYLKQKREGSEEEME